MRDVLLEDRAVEAEAHADRVDLRLRGRGTGDEGRLVAGHGFEDQEDDRDHAECDRHDAQQAQGDEGDQGH